MMPIIQIGPLVFQSSILALIFALWIGTFVAEQETRQRNLRGFEAWNALAVFGAGTAFAGRLIYVAQNFSAYTTDWLSVFSFSPQTMDLQYGMVCGGIAVLVYIRWRYIPLARFADALALGVLVVIAIFSFGQYLGGEAYGTETGVFWAIPLLGAYRHPVQLYECLGVIVGLVAAKFFVQRIGRDGIVALFAVAWYSGVRLVVDAFRADITVLPNGYRAPQVVALVVLLIALWGMMRITTNDGGQMNA